MPESTARVDRTTKKEFYDRDQRLIPTPEEAERQRAEAAEAEIARLRELLEPK